MTHLHIMGVGGAGASGFAEIARASGFKVSGCDLSTGGHDPSHLEEVDILIVSPAILAFDRKNEELSAAKERGLPLYTWQEFLGRNLMKGKPVIGVCGSHGKTTVAAMLAYLLERAGLDPSYLIGSPPVGGCNFRVGTGPFLVEADEYWGSFLNYPVDLSVCVSLEFDHPDYFADFSSYLAIFEKFVRHGSVLVAQSSDPGVSQLIGRLKTWPGGILSFSSPYAGSLRLAGEHNRINAQAVHKAAEFLRVDELEIRRALSRFPGVGRRLELVGSRGGEFVYSDYAHHPTQVEAVATTLRDLYPDKKIVVIFQPHTYSRTYTLLEDFVQVLSSAPADYILVTDIFPSREKDTGIISSREVVGRVGKKNVRYEPFKQVLGEVRNLRPDVAAFLGAGNIDKLAVCYAKT